MLHAGFTSSWQARWLSGHAILPVYWPLFIRTCMRTYVNANGRSRNEPYFLACHDRPISDGAKHARGGHNRVEKVAATGVKADNGV